MFPVLRLEPPPSSPEERDKLVNEWYAKVKALSPEERAAMYKDGSGTKAPPWLTDWYLLDDLLRELIGWDKAKVRSAKTLERLQAAEAAKREK